MIEIRTVQITWFVEVGYCDSGGIGRWDGTKESILCDTEAEAESLCDKWLASGKLYRTSWGEIRPRYDYGMFRIRRAERVLSVTKDTAADLAEADAPIVEKE